MVLSSWQSHCESSPGSFDECRMAPSGRRPNTKPDDLGCESACTGCQKLHPPSPFIITQPESWYSFYRPTEGRRLSRPSWLVTYRDGTARLERPACWHRFCTATGHFQAALDDLSVWTIIRLTTDLVICPWSFAYSRINTVVNNNNNNNNGLPVHRRSPIRVLTGSDVAQLRWSKPTCYH